MLTVSATQIELMQKIARRIDRKLSLQLHHLADGSIEVKLSQGPRKAETRVGGAALEAARDDVAQFEALLLQIKRVYDRMWAPVPPKRLVWRSTAISRLASTGGQRGKPGGRGNAHARVPPNASGGRTRLSANRRISASVAATRMRCIPGAVNLGGGDAPADQRSRSADAIGGIWEIARARDQAHERFA
jgi:hypothetical protein